MSVGEVAVLSRCCSIAPNSRRFAETSLCGSWFDSSALGPDVFENESGDDQTEENPDDAIADVVEIRVRRKTLENAVEKSECDL
jgi:hypothetical protein